MALSARDTGKFFSTAILGFLSGLVRTDMRHLLSQLADLMPWMSAPRDHHITLVAQGDLAGAASVHTGYFEATRPMEVGFVKTNFGAVPGTFVALTAEARITPSGVAEVSGMLSDAPVSVLTADVTPITISLEDDSTALDTAQLWYLAKGDKIRMKLVEAGGSGTMVGQAIQFQLVVREV